MINEEFQRRPGVPWRITQTGTAAIALHEAGLRLAVAGAQQDRYANAQLDDYTGLARRQLPWRPPLRLTVRARMHGPIAGTAGFGFWNGPIAPNTWPALPAAIWFLYASPPSDMPLAAGVPGYGWKAACIDATTPAALAWVPLTLPVLLLNRSRRLYHRIWPRVQRALRISEKSLPEPDNDWHTYTLEWHRQSACFAIDGVIVHTTNQAPTGPLGFVAWIDNQWCITTPEGRFGWGLLDAPGQAIDLGMVRIEEI